jgi:glutathione synthase/RimK-type ligase-like ATP-grasp enzyme
MLPDVPFVGWDVALTTKGVYLLEVNLSCNFFRGAFDKKTYFEFCRDYMAGLQPLREAQEKAGGVKGKTN